MMMIRCPQRGSYLKLLATYGRALLVLLALLILVGCQGLSAGAPSDPPQQSGALSLNHPTLDFGNVAVGKSKTLTVTASNSGSADITITGASSTAAQFVLTKPTVPVTIVAGQDATLSVTFTPSATGNLKATLSFASDATNGSVELSLSGDGADAGTLAVVPTSLAFGSLLVGDNRSLPGTLTNTGGSDLTLSQATVTGTGFGLTGLTLPLTLTAGQSASFSVTFIPQSLGAVNGNVAFVSDASDPTLNLPLSGTGLAPGSLSPNPASLDFGTVQIGDDKTLPQTLTNTGSSTVTITQGTVTGSGFSVTGINLPVTLPAGQSTSFHVVFTPSSAGSSSGNITITSDASNPTLIIPLAGVGVAPGALGANPTSLNFGSVTVGDNKTLSESLTNTGGSNVTISQDTITGAGFSVSGLNLPLTLTPGQKKTFSVIFAPSSTGGKSGNLTIVSDGSNPSLVIPLSGTGVAEGTLGANPTSINFGNVTVGKNKTLTETLTNTGGSNVTISQDTVTGAGYSVSGLNLPLTLTPGQQKTFNVIFTPPSIGSKSGNLTIVSDASNPSLVIPLSGTGVAPGTLGANPTSVSFGSVTVGKNKTLSETLTNTGGSDVTISQDTVTGTGFSVSGLNLPLALTPGQQKTFSVIFAPQSTGSKSGNLTIVSDASNPSLVIPLSGTGVAPGTLSPNPSSLSFGNVQVGQNKTLPETVTNSGGSDVTISQDAITGAGFSVSGLNLPLTLTAGQQKTFNVIFTPQSSGAVNGNLTITSDASNPSLVIPLSGTGTPAGQLAVNPTSLDFGDVTVGNNAGLPATLNATGASVTVTSGSSSSSEFTFSGLTFPFTIQAGQNKGFTVTFAPQAAGVANATLTFNSDASNSPTIQSLTGNGIAAVQHSVLLSWTASTSSDVSGYNVYRGTQAGGPYSKINSSLNAGTTYTDTSVTNGHTYYYVTTAVDSSNDESTYSNEVPAVIPPS